MINEVSPVTVIPADNVAAVAQANDKSLASPPPGYRRLAVYLCLAHPVSGLPSNTLVTTAIVEAESAEAIAAIFHPLQLAGALVNFVPVMELPVEPVLAEEEKKLGG